MITSKNKKAGRPQEEIAKKALTNAALKLFSEKGYESTSIRDIANKADVNSALVSYHFKNKLGLFAQIIVQHTAKLRNRFLKKRDTYSSNKEQIQAILDSMGNLLIKNKTMPRLGAKTMLSNSNNEIKKIILNQVAIPTHKTLINLFSGCELNTKLESHESRNLSMLSTGAIIFWGLFADEYADIYGFKNGDELRKANLEFVKKYLDEMIID